MGQENKKPFQKNDWLFMAWCVGMIHYAPQPREDTSTLLTNLQSTEISDRLGRMIPPTKPTQPAFI